jgi:hypothetical protein
MSSELALLKCLADDKQVFDKYYPYISQLKNMDRDVKLLYDLLAKYYEQYDVAGVSQPDFTLYYKHMYPTTKNKVLHTEMIRNLFDLDVNHDIAQDMLERVMEQHYASKMIQDLMPVVEETKWGVLPSIEEKAKEFITKMKNPPPEARTLTPSRMTIEELVRKEIEPDGFTWPLQGLQDSIGVVRKGKWGLGFAYVDTGKSSFGARCTAHWLRQMQDDEILLYCGNEEGSASIDLRVTQSLLDWTKDQIAADPTRADAMRIERGFNRMLMFDSIYHIKNIRSLLEEHQPAIIVIDQVTKLRTDSKTQDIEALTNVANFCRESAKEFDCHIFGLAQATGECADKMYPELKDLYNSRVGIQGELDYAIGVGMNTKIESQSNRRYFYVSKNKFGDKPKFGTIFDPANNKWTMI